MPPSGINSTALVDVNVWLALAYEGHVHHSAAIAWLDQAPPRKAGFCRVTQLGFLRLLTNRSVMSGSVLSQRESWGCYEKFRSDDRVIFLDEPASIESTWKKLTRSARSDAGTWTDAYLAGFAIAESLAFVTFDRGFTRYNHLSLALLEH
jgi:uncharacterized protein